jgi:hypothetical protein
MVVGSPVTADAEYAVSSDDWTHLMVNLPVGKQKLEIPDNVIANAVTLNTYVFAVLRAFEFIARRKPYPVVNSIANLAWKLEERERFGEPP